MSIWWYIVEEDDDVLNIHQIEWMSWNNNNNNKIIKQIVGNNEWQMLGVVLYVSCFF